MSILKQRYNPILVHERNQSGSKFTTRFQERCDGVDAELALFDSDVRPSQQKHPFDRIT